MLNFVDILLFKKHYRRKTMDRNYLLLFFLIISYIRGYRCADCFYFSNLNLFLRIYFQFKFKFPTFEDASFTYLTKWYYFIFFINKYFLQIKFI